MHSSWLADFSVKNKIPKKGTLSEASVGARNKISISFDCRQIKNSCVVNVHTNITDEDSQYITDQLAVIMITVLLGDGGSERVLPSQLLSDDNRVKFVVSLLDLENMNVSTAITEEQKIKVKILDVCFQQHLINRIKKQMPA